MRVQQFTRQHAVRAGQGVAEGHVMAQDRYLHFEEFIEIGIGDAQKTQALQQRYGRVLRLRQHAGVELQLRQLAIEVKLRILEIWRTGHGNFIDFSISRWRKKVAGGGSGWSIMVWPVSLRATAAAALCASTLCRPRQRVK